MNTNSYIDFIAANNWIIGTGILLLYIGFIGWLMYKAREDRIEVPRYLSAPPDDATPAEAVGLAFEGSKYSSAIVLATFVDLAERGFYKTYANEDPKTLAVKLSFEVVDKNNPEAAERQLDNLTVYEKSVRRFFDEVLGNKDMSLEEMKSRIQKDTGRWNTLWVIVNRRVREGCRQAYVWEDTYSHGFRKAGKIFFIAALVLFSAALILAGANWLSFLAILPPLITIISVWLFLPTHYLNKMTRRSRTRSLQWRSFARWTNDFPKLEEAPVISIELWQSIITYSIAFETAENIVDKGSLPEKLQVDPLTSLQMATPAIDSRSDDFLEAFGFAAIATIWLGSKIDISSPF